MRPLRLSGDLKGTRTPLSDTCVAVFTPPSYNWFLSLRNQHVRLVTTASASYPIIRDAKYGHTPAKTPNWLSVRNATHRTSHNGQS